MEALQLCEDAAGRILFLRVLVDAYPTKSKLRYQQRLGRIMRPLKGVVDGVKTGGFDPLLRKTHIAQSAKPIATVMDFCGNAGRHKLIHAVDILGGKISNRTRELIEHKLKESGRPVRVSLTVPRVCRTDRV